MERKVSQLVDMGVTAGQARAALRDHGDVMEAAEAIFTGKYDDVDANGNVEMTSAGPSAETAVRPVLRIATPDSDVIDDSDGVMEDEGEDDYLDYDSEADEKAVAAQDNTSVDPYAGVFFSKDRREEVIEIEEESKRIFISEANENAKLMTQGQWMKGCPEGGEQSFLFSLYQQLSEGECHCPHGCGKSVVRKNQDFFVLFDEFSTYIEHLQRIVPRKCKGCAKNFCFACGESAPDLGPETPANEPLFHCANLQGAILGVGLAMLERQYSDETKVISTEAAQQGRSASKRRKVDIAPVPVHPDDDDDDDDEDDSYYPVFHGLRPGKGKKAKLGTGYAGDTKEDNSGQIEAQAVQCAKDEQLSNLLMSIRVYLPSVHRKGGGRTSDYLVHPATLAHLRRRFNFVSSQLLRNDSLTDMSDRSVLYFELLEWLETISSHEALSSMMAMPIMVVSSVKTVAAKKAPGRGTPRIRERTVVYEGSSGPRELLEAIVIQAQAALKGLEGTNNVDDQSSEMTEEQKRMTTDEKGKTKDLARVSSEENKKLHGFCTRILGTAKAIDRSLRETKGDAFVERLHAALPKIPRASEEDIRVDVGQTEEETQKRYLEWANRVRFEYCDLSIPGEFSENMKPEDYYPAFKFYFSSEARMLANSDIPKRSLAIAKELAVLTTNLPVAWNSSVFLRVDETRVDVIKALITGPEGTPYYNGCFLFDIFLGASYNQSPPSVKYMTTNGGKFRFNPNLYADGKVCLSLLGTWQGPGWISGKSTLLQVLVSIQSMILCEEPYLNEPGWASSGGTPASLAYSANLRRMVVKTAMLGNLKTPPEPFRDVIRTHFRLKAHSVSVQLDEWLAQDDGKALVDDGVHSGRALTSGSSNGLAEDVAELKQMLKQLQDEEPPTAE